MRKNYRNERGKVDSYSMLIVGKYFMSSDDYRRIILVNSKYADLLDQYRYNPHRDTTLFPLIETQVLYTRKDVLLDGMFKYVISYPIDYKEYLLFPESIRNKIEFRNVKLTERNVIDYSELSPNSTGEAILGTRRKMYFETIISMPFRKYTVPPFINSLDINCFNSNLYLKEIVLPKSVTCIGNYVFKKCERLSTITLPKHLRIIGNESFRESALNKVIIPRKVKRIGVRCFEGCPLTEIIIPEGVYEIGSGCFENNKFLSSVKLSPYIKIIPSNIFAHCTSLESLTIPVGIQQIDSRAFYNCGITSLTLPSSITKLSLDAFDCSSMKKLIQIGTTEIHYEVSLYQAILFRESGTKCHSITFRKEDMKYLSDKLFNEVNCINDQAFENESIQSITLPSQLKEIRKFAFYNCKQLEIIVVPETIEKIDTTCFSSCKLNQIYLPKKLESLDIDFEGLLEDYYQFYY